MHKIIFSCGDCNGIGIETFAKAVSTLDNTPELASKCNLTLAVNVETLKNYLKHFSMPVKFESDGIFIANRLVYIINCRKEADISFGKVAKDAGELAAESLEIATNDTSRGIFDALITLPINKFSMNKAGWLFTGHTEFLGSINNVAKPLMLLTTGKLRVAIATIHIPIKDVAATITNELLTMRIIQLFNTLQNDFNIAKPKIALLGLNPHAGENGVIGNEEQNIINPLINNFKEKGFMIDGSFPADGFFAHKEYKNYDGVLAMYHDQGLIPLKMLADGGGVNFTASIPIIRTSPDHGTAFNIAGKDLADGKSVFEAIELAIQIVENRKKQNSH